MTIHHPKVKKVLRQCERRIMKMTGRAPISVFILTAPTFIVPYDEIEKVVCEITGIRIELIKLPSRCYEYRLPRQLICFYARAHTHMSYKLIGQKVNRHDHTTVMNSIHRIKSLIETSDPEVCKIVRDINLRMEQLKES